MPLMQGHRNKLFPHSRVSLEPREVCCGASGVSPLGGTSGPLHRGCSLPPHLGAPLALWGLGHLLHRRVGWRTCRAVPRGVPASWPQPVWPGPLMCARGVNLWPQTSEAETTTAVVEGVIDRFPGDSRHTGTPVLAWKRRPLAQSPHQWGVVARW